MKKILFIVRRIIFAFCIIYAFNLIVVGLEIFIPLNIVTISVVSLLGMPGLLSLIGIYFVIL